MGSVVQLASSPVEEVLPVVEHALVTLAGAAVFPTDTVYGIGQAVSANPDGPGLLFSIKRRPLGKVVPWLVGSASDVARYCTDVPSYVPALVEAFWPGGLTLVLRASSEVPPAYRAADGTVALRNPRSDFLLALIDRIGSPLATTSANTSGLPAPLSFAEVEPRIVEEATVTVDGGRAGGDRASTVLVCLPDAPRVSRAGTVSERAVCDLLGLETLAGLPPEGK